MIAAKGRCGEVDQEQLYPLISFTLGSLAGLADLLRSERKISRRVVAASLLWHGLMSAAAAFLLSEQISNRAILYGMSILVGAGTFSIADVLVAGVRSRIGMGQVGRGGGHVGPPAAPGDTPPPPPAADA